mgnify:CR=1 FL=1
MADETQKSPAELRAERFERLRYDWGNVTDKATLGHLYDKIETVRNSIETLPKQIGDLRERGYVYGNDWETRVASLDEAWPDRSRKARRYLRDQAHRMEPLIEDIERFCDRTRLTDGQMDRLEEKIARAEDWIGDADSQVRTIFSTLDEELAELNQQLTQAEYLLDGLDDATFPLLPEEDGVAACETIWTSGKQEPKGILFVTNHRLVFEQREKIATKKVLFITTKSELVQEKLWEAPVGSVTEIAAEDKGKLMFSKEFLHLTFAHDIRTVPEKVTLRLKGRDNDDLRAWIERAKTGEIAAYRYEPPVEEPVAKPEAAAQSEPASKVEAPADEVPTVCPACGAQLPTVYQGMQELVCQYCGSKVRL